MKTEEIQKGMTVLMPSGTKAKVLSEPVSTVLIEVDYESFTQDTQYSVDLLRPYVPTIEELAIAYKNVWQSEQPYYKVNEARYALFDAIDRIPNV
jgi:hypothetical protein